LHPFDIKSVIFAKHAQHVVLIHFPIALFIIGVLFDFLAYRTRRRVLAAAAYCNLFAAALATIPVLITGIHRMAMGTRRAAAQRHPSDPFGVRCRVKRADLARVADSPESEA